MRDKAIVETARRHAIPLTLESAGQRLLDAIDPAVSLVLIGEATHGTHEFYRIRADLTRALIERLGHRMMAAIDWADGEPDVSMLPSPALAPAPAPPNVRTRYAP